jgi:hypothetical protein
LNSKAHFEWRGERFFGDDVFGFFTHRK